MKQKKINNLWSQLKKQSLKTAKREISTEETWNEIKVLDIYLDFSRTYLGKDAMKTLISIAKETKVEHFRDAMFAGEKINSSENRAVLHTALRAKKREKISKEIFEKIKKTQKAMLAFVEQVEEGKVRGAKADHFTHVVNIGIGGSYLGSRLVSEALADYQNKRPKVLFVSNVDPTAMEDCLAKVPIEKTLFVVASKTFTTQETMCNATLAKKILVAKLGKEAVAKHFVALSTNAAAVEKFGINKERMFPFWDFVGGRYSLWSSIGLPIALGIGVKNFKQLLDGAAEMDQHFLNAPLEKNLPVLLALIHIYWNDALNYRSRVIVPYLERLSALPLYLQQLEMESNGKSIDKQGKPVTENTSTHVWGETGTNAQHSFFQLLHQGTHKAPVDFISAAKTIAKGKSSQDQHHLLLSNLFAQMQALDIGLSEKEVRKQMIAQGVSSKEIDQLAPQKTFLGGRPSLLLMLEKLDAKNLGKLLALYEHKVFVEGIVWGINSFDQWGVELGKKIANQIQQTIKKKKAAEKLPSYTKRLAKRFLS